MQEKLENVHYGHILPLFNLWKPILSFVKTFETGSKK